jgi:hypothetical protein
MVFGVRPTPANAVDRKKYFIRAVAFSMNGFGDQFFSSAGFTFCFITDNLY